MLMGMLPKQLTLPATMFPNTYTNIPNSPSKFITWPVGLFATEDLTPTEQECKKAITREMCKYWQVEKLRFGQFQRSLHRCSLVEDPTRQVFLSYPEVLEAIASRRIAAMAPPKNAPTARS